MSKTIDRIEKIAGTSIGNLGDPLAPFQTTLEAKGLPVPGDEWIWQVRSGVRQGGYMLGRMEKALLVQQLDPSKKDRFYRRFATEAVSVRTHGDNWYRNRYTSEGFVPQVASEFQIDAKDASRTLRSMRLDLIYGYQHNSDLEEMHKNIVEEYFRGNIDSLPPSLRRTSVIALYENWDRKSIPSFYRALYQAMKGSVRAIGGYVPYEVELMQCFYEGRTKYKPSARPTPFDMKVFKVDGDTDAVGLATDLKTELDIPVGRNNIYVHRNALVYGTVRADFLSKSNRDIE